MKKVIVLILFLISNFSIGQISNRLFGPQNFLQNISPNNFVYTIPPNDNRFFVASMDALRLHTYNVLGVNDTIRSVGDIRYKSISYTPTVLEITTALGFNPLSSEYDPVWLSVAMEYRTKLQNDLLYQPAGTYLTPSSTNTLTNKSGNISQWTNDSLYLTSVPAQSFSSLTGKPITLLGYGITDAYPLTGNPSGFLTTEVDGSVTNELEPAGIIEFYGGTSAPIGYLMCDGSSVSRTTYSVLFGVINTTYGVGDGSTTFNLPDLRQRFPLGKAVSGTGSTLGSTGGTIDHLHTVNPPNTTTGAPSGTSGQLVGVINVASSAHTHDVDIAQFNSGTANPPYLVLNAIIKY